MSLKEVEKLFKFRVPRNMETKSKIFKLFYCILTNLQEDLKRMLNNSQVVRKQEKKQEVLLSKMSMVKRQVCLLLPHNHMTLCLIIYLQQTLKIYLHLIHHFNYKTQNLASVQKIIEPFDSIVTEHSISQCVLQNSAACLFVYTNF